MPVGEESASGALALLRRQPAFRRLIAARVLSFTGSSLSLVALMLHVAATTGQALAVAALLLVGDAAPALLSPLTGAVSDRFDRRRVMLACELLQAGLLAAIAVTLPTLAVLLALVGARAVAGQVFQPASRAAIPALVPGRDLEVANSTVGLGVNGAEPDFAAIQRAQIRTFRAAHPAGDAARVSQGLVVIPTDSATPAQREKYAAYVAQRLPRTASPQGPARMLFAPDLIGTAEQIAEQLHAHAGFREVREVAFALPFSFADEDYEQILTDIATRLGPALGWRATG